MTLKLSFMKCPERKISQRILPFSKFTQKLSVPDKFSDSQFVFNKNSQTFKNAVTQKR